MISTVLLMIIISAGCIGFDQQKSNNISEPVQCQIAASSEKIVTINETHSNSKVCAKPGSTITIQLKENSRTGYQWQMTASPGLEIVDEGVRWFDENDLPTTIVGIKAVHEWKISTKEPGIQTIKAILRRPERVTGSESVFNLNVVVE